MLGGDERNRKDDVSELRREKLCRVQYPSRERTDGAQFVLRSLKCDHFYYQLLKQGKRDLHARTLHLFSIPDS